jgi:adenylate kinase family enzyme
MALAILIGASGAGKTTLADAFAARHPDVDVLRFDSIGIPSPEVMIAEYGSGEAWQRAMTLRWLRDIAGRLAEVRSILFEGQTRPAFLAEAAAAAGIADYRLILIDCDDATRIRRLGGERGQPELADARMLRWAAWLRAEAQREGHPILDTSAIDVDEAVAAIHALGFGG